MKATETENGPIYVHCGNMADLSFIPDNSVDLVWSGQSIKHISREDAFILYKEVKRVLKEDGNFCLDTPNRLITEMHTAWNDGGWIHPEHKIEYYPDDLKNDLTEAGFKILEERGVCEIPKTWNTKTFDYADFILGNALP